MFRCPKCGRVTEPSARLCPGCGVILAKVRARVGAPTDPPPNGDRRRPLSVPPSLPPPPRRRVSDFSSFTPPPTKPGRLETRPETDAHTPPGVAAFKVALAAAASIAALYVFGAFGSAPNPEPSQPSFSVPTPRPSASSLPVSPVSAEGLSADDQMFLGDLARRLSVPNGPLPSESDLARLADVLRRSNDDPRVRELTFAAYAIQAERALQSGAYTLLNESLVRMRLLDNRHPRLYELETYGRARQGDWPGAETAARTFESLGKESLGIAATLAASLQRQGRSPEALAVLDRPLFSTCPSATTPFDIQACRTAQELRQALSSPATERVAEIERPREALAVSPSKQQIQSDRFDVRFEGDSQSGVARDVLFVLDRAYVRLSDVYYERPTRKVPVVLHTSQSYYAATGAPWWSGGQYSSHNGAIQIPIRGLPSTLPKEMEDVLVHELSHAFVDEMSGGLAGRDLQEGLAQYMEGKRIESEMTSAELKSLANSGGRNVMNFYMLSLAVSQQLIRSNGQSRINDLLKAMKEAGSEDGGFKKVLGQTGAAVRRDILDTFWRRYS